jgi:hypothetical protein
MRATKRQLSLRAALVPLFALAISGVAMQVQAQSTSGTPTTQQEMQRGVPGVDVDVGTSGRARSNGVPGVDVDVNTTNRRAGGTAGVDVDTRTSGAGAGTRRAERQARMDRN